MRNTRTIAAVILLIAIVGLLPMACKSKKKSSTEPTSQGTVVSQSTPAATQPGGSPLAINPCGLISKDEAAAALGEDVGAGEASPATNLDVTPGLTVSASSCDYTSVATAHYIGIDYWAASGDKADAVQQAISAVCGGKEAISGLGDVACWYDADHTEIQVATGAAFIDITIAMSGDATQALQTLAQAAVGNLS